MHTVKTFCLAVTLRLSISRLRADRIPRETARLLSELHKLDQRRAYESKTYHGRDDMDDIALSERFDIDLQDILQFTILSGHRELT